MPSVARLSTSLVLALVLVAATFPLMVLADSYESTVSITNPDLTKACGLDVLMILDESGSIASSHATDEVQDAFRAFVDSLKNTGSSMSTIEFSTVARLPSIGGVAAGEYITIDDSTLPGFEDYIANRYNPNSKTNWEDALRVGRYFAPRPDFAIPHLVVFITDGDPTQVIRNDRVTPTEYRTKVPLDDNETTDSNGDAGARPAVPNANALKAAGSHILAIGVGSALQNDDSVDRLVSVSGPNIFDGTGDFDISTTDVYLEADFDELADALRDAAFQLCAPSVTVRKLYDPTPDPDSLDDAVPGVGWTMTGTVLSVPAPNLFDWVLPSDQAGAATAPDSVTGVTDGAGFVTFQWTPLNPDGNSGFQLTEVSAANPPDPPGGGYSNVPSQTRCSYRTPDTPDTPLTIGTIDPDGGFTIDIPPESIVTCTLVNIADPAPGIEIEKSTNGTDADFAPGPVIPVGDPVTWTYLVTNTGNTTLNNLAVEDSDIGTVTCPTTIPIDQSVTCTATGVAVAGQYENTATATATDTHGITVDDDDPSHYFGAAPGIAVKKFTNGADADTPFGPGILVGDPVNWTYAVSLGGGNVALENVILVDDAGTPSAPGDDFNPTLDSGDDGDGILEIGETWNYSAVGTAVPGQYENFAFAAGDPVGPSTVQVVDNDPSHYYGVISSVSIKKYTNEADADLPTDPDVPVIKVGAPVNWTYVVTNTGNVPIISWTVTDDIEGNASCSRSFLAVGASAICQISGTAEEGTYANIGTVNATDILGNPITDSDPSHYIGVQPALIIVKTTNGQDANLPTGPFIPVGGVVTWDYVVTNIGSADLTDLVVTDLKIGGPPGLVTCDDTDLAAGASTNCQATGIAVAGQYTNLASAVAIDPFGDPVWASDPSHYFGADSAITLKKYTNGVDGNEPNGALIPVGDPVEWTYEIINRGNSTLDNIELVDDQIGAVTCPVTTLAPGAATTCAATGVAERGLYSNVGTVTATDPLDQVVTATDPSHYYGFLLQIDIEKYTNGQDADTPTGPSIPVGDPVTWTYVVTNPGDFYFSNVVVTDDQGVTPVLQGGDTNGDGFLDPGETWTYQATGVAVAGQYENTATVEGTVGQELDNIMTDSDPSHYFGLDASIDIQKTPDVAVVEINAPHTFDITVTNTGNVTLTNVVVTDPVTPSCDRTIGTMLPGAVVTYSCDVAHVTGFINNTAFVVGTTPEDSIVEDQDSAAVTLVGAGGTAALGDTVWHDLNRNGVQEAGEPGIPNARVTIGLDPDTVTTLAAPIEITVVTDSTGHYLAGNLVAGVYTVTLDQSSVRGTLTTPGAYQVTLSTGQVDLQSDFGLADVLPFTGINNMQLLIEMGIALLLVGTMLVVGFREEESG